MSKEWIIDVLGDLRGFARANAMPALAVQLEEALVVAALEIAPSSGIQAGRNGAEIGRRAGAVR